MEGQKTIARFLREAGCSTGLAGKWHCGRFWRKQAGFDTWFTSACGTNAKFGAQAYYEDEDRIEFFGHQETILTDRAVRFLNEHKKQGTQQPFFLFLGYTNIHTRIPGKRKRS
ncbi:MAG: sulfatase-like hydrolase/transferase [Oceanipulchritudo sp.]